MTSADFGVADYGSVVILFAHTPEARAWVDENLASDRATFAGGVAIEARCITGIVDAALADNLTVEWQP